MTELQIGPDEIRDALQKFVTDYKPSAASVEEVGHVSDAGDGIAHVEGLPSAMANELLEFQDGTLGLALNLDVRDIGVVVLGEFDGIEEGQTVRRTGEVLSVPVGDGYLGRVVNPLGNPIDGLGEIDGIDGRRALELQAPTVMQRKSVHEPLLTGIKAIDSLTPIGRGQRQLIIGDRQTGKTAIAIDTIINQKEFWDSGDPSKQVRCIYVGIGQKGSTIAAVLIFYAWTAIVSLSFLLMYIGTQSGWPGDYLIGVAFGLVGVAACLFVTFLPSRRQVVATAATLEPNRETIACRRASRRSTR